VLVSAADASPISPIIFPPDSDTIFKVKFDPLVNSTQVRSTLGLARARRADPPPQLYGNCFQQDGEDGTDVLCGRYINNNAPILSSPCSRTLSRNRYVFAITIGKGGDGEPIARQTRVKLGKSWIRQGTSGTLVHAVALSDPGRATADLVCSLPPGIELSGRVQYAGACPGLVPQ
jgi:hypothetical protein